MTSDTDRETIALLRKRLLGASEEAIVTAYYAGEHAGMKRAAEAAEGEAVELVGPGDGAYNNAIRDAVDAIRRLAGMTTLRAWYLGFTDHVSGRCDAGRDWPRANWMYAYMRGLGCGGLV